MGAQPLMLSARPRLSLPLWSKPFTQSLTIHPNIRPLGTQFSHHHLNLLGHLHICIQVDVRSLGAHDILHRGHVAKLDFYEHCNESTLES